MEIVELEQELRLELRVSFCQQHYVEELLLIILENLSKETVPSFLLSK
jgi:hypothetical protein